MSDAAQSLYNAKTSIDDSAAVAKLLETIDLKKNIANYRVELQLKKDPKSLTVNFDIVVAEKNQKTFDEKVRKYAEQILALVTDAEEVTWVYEVKPEGKKKQEATVYLNTEGATELLKNDVKSYGESAKGIQTLLDQQKGY